MNDAWDRGSRHMEALTGTSRSSATFEGDITLPISFGNKDAAAFHRFKAFSSAIVKDAEVAEALKESLAQALEQGQSLEEWKKSAGTVFDKLGVSRLNSWQAEFIYRNENALAYGAGKWASLQKVKRSFPYWRYSTMKDHRVRPSHRALEGKVFSSDDKQYFPPIGWLCRCVAVPISRREAEKLGITKPDTVTPEMRAELKNAEFIGDKIKLFEDWLNEKMKTLDPARQELIRKAADEIRLGVKDLYTAYAASPDHTEIAHNAVTNAFVVQHRNADKHDLTANLNAATRLHENGWSVVINEHAYEFRKPNPEFTIIDTKGRIWISDLKTPDPSKYTSIVHGIRTAVKGARKQQLTHVVINITANEPLESIAEAIDKSFERYGIMDRLIILMGDKGIEIRKTDYGKGKTLEVLKEGLK